MKRLPVVSSAGAEEDLIAIWRYIALDSPAAADRMPDQIESRCLQISDYPYSGVGRPDLGSDVRCLVFRRYLILYRVREDALEILRVLRGHRNITADDIAG